MALIEAKIILIHLSPSMIICNLRWIEEFSQSCLHMIDLYILSKNKQNTINEKKKILKYISVLFVDGYYII